MLHLIIDSKFLPAPIEDVFKKEKKVRSVIPIVHPKYSGDNISVVITNMSDESSECWVIEVTNDLEFHGQSQKLTLSSRMEFGILPITEDFSLSATLKYE